MYKNTNTKTNVFNRYVICIVLLIASIIICTGEPEVHAAEIDDTDIVLSGDEGITKDTDQENIELPPSSAENIPAAPGSADEELSSDSKAVEENMNVPEAADKLKSESESESESESKLELDSESATNTGTEEQLDSESPIDSEGSIDSNEPADSEEQINSEEPLIEPAAELTASSAEEVLSDQMLLFSAFAAKKAERKDGVYIIDNVPYVYDNDGNLVKNAWYKTSAGQITYGDANGITILNDVMPLAEGNYVFGADGYLVKNAWIETADGKKAYGNPNTGEAYTKGAFSVKDGDCYVRYVFDQNGYLLKDDWVYEEGYGWAYGRPEDGAAYIRGAFTVKDNIRYAFDNYGFVAENRWIYEPGYGYAFGRPRAPGSERGGAVYRKGAFTVSDGIRYAFDNYGYLAENRWIYEPGYGYAFGRPKAPGSERGGAVYRGGAFTVSDGIRYVFDNYGYRAAGKWVYEPGYGYTYGDQNGVAIRNKSVWIYDTQFYFNSIGYWGLNMQAKDLENLANRQIIEFMGPLCSEDQKKSGILASISLAQIIQESGYTKSELAIAANNLFGMKKRLSGNTWPNSSWDGQSVYEKETKEWDDEKKEFITIKAEFRAYPRIQESVADHSAYLLGAKNGTELRYKGLKGETDYVKAITIIKNGGYATDPNYIDKICKLIRQNNLTRFDLK